MFTLLIVCHLASKGQWRTIGNVNQTPPTNFVGTTDASSFVFRVNNIKSGYFDADFSTRNSSFGYQSMASNISGTNNSAFGYNALQFNQSGSLNIAFGYNSLSQILGSENIGIGVNTLSNHSNISSHTNIGIGNNTFSLLNTNNNGRQTSNIAIGFESLLSLDYTGDGSHTAIGYKALTYAGWEGYLNTTIGSESLGIGHFATAHGYQSVGLQPQYYAQNGGYGTTTQGYKSLFIGGFWNTIAIGSLSLFSNDPTNFDFGSIAIGYKALNNCTINSNGQLFYLSNLAVGANSFTNLSSAQFKNTGIGYNVQINSNISNTSTIGYNTIGTASNQIRIGNVSVSSVGGFTNWTTISDLRTKKNIKKALLGLEFIMNLNPVTYQISHPNHQEGKTNQEVKTGLIAQELSALLEENSYKNTSIIKTPTSNNDHYAIRYSELTVPIINSIKDLAQSLNQLETKAKNNEEKIKIINSKIELLNDLIKKK